MPLKNYFGNLIFCVPLLSIFFLETKCKSSTQSNDNLVKSLVQSSNDDLLKDIKEVLRTLSNIKQHIAETRMKAANLASQELIKLYWAIGRIIFEKQQITSWGSSVMEKLAKDLQNEFSAMSDFSQRNVFRIQAFYVAYQKLEILDKSSL